MEPFGLKATLLATAIAVLLSARAIKRKSLTNTGAMAAFGVGFGSVITGTRGFNLLVFYQIATTATKYKKDIKATKDGTFFTSAIRGPSQVLACSIIAVVLSLVHAIYCGAEQAIDFRNQPLASSLTCAILAHHSTCLADSLASELGILSTETPILITQPWRKVPAGTNGGITLWGTLWSAIGGFLIGFAYVVTDYLSGILMLPLHHAVRFLLLGTICGLVGSLIDSLLGATLQQTFWDDEKKLIFHSDGKPNSAKLLIGINLLNNEQVNLVSVALTTALGGLVIGPMVFQ
jgi:uncharacterized protein (TIGR00297 family)